MSQRPPEIIRLVVPTSFTDKDIEEFKLLLVKSTSHGKWENLTILLTNKAFDYTVVDTEFMDKLRDIKHTTFEAKKNESSK